MTLMNEHYSCRMINIGASLKTFTNFHLCWIFLFQSPCHLFLNHLLNHDHVVDKKSWLHQSIKQSRATKKYKIFSFVVRIILSLFDVEKSEPTSQTCFFRIRLTCCGDNMKVGGVVECRHLLTQVNALLYRALTSLEFVNVKK